jgi:hypothetical protein
MALKVVADITAPPDPFSPGGPITFSVTLRDDAAPTAGVDHVLTLKLDRRNGYTFDGGVKSIDRTKSIKKSPTPIKLNTRIAGEKTPFGFTVSLFEGTELLSSVDVAVA